MIIHIDILKDKE